MNRTGVRIPRELKEIISSLAKKMGISQNALIAYALWEHVNKLKERSFAK